MRLKKTTHIKQKLGIQTVLATINNCRVKRVKELNKSREIVLIQSQYNQQQPLVL